MCTTKSINFNHLREAIEQYVEANPEGPMIKGIPSHIGTDGLAYGYAQTDDTAAIRGIEELATNMEGVAE